MMTAPIFTKYRKQTARGTKISVYHRDNSKTLWVEASGLSAMRLHWEAAKKFLNSLPDMGYWSRYPWAGYRQKNNDGFIFVMATENFLIHTPNEKKEG